MQCILITRIGLLFRPWLWDIFLLRALKSLLSVQLDRVDQLLFNLGSLSLKYWIMNFYICAVLQREYFHFFLQTSDNGHAHFLQFIAKYCQGDLRVHFRKRHNSVAKYLYWIAFAFKLKISFRKLKNFKLATLTHTSLVDNNTTSRNNAMHFDHSKRGLLSHLTPSVSLPWVGGRDTQKTRLIIKNQNANESRLD